MLEHLYSTVIVDKNITEKNTSFTDCLFKGILYYVNLELIYYRWVRWEELLTSSALLTRKSFNSTSIAQSV